MNETNKYSTLVNNTVLISAGTFGSKLLTFLMVRFYTDFLTPSEYGTADLIIQTANLLIPLVSIGISESVFRFAVNDENRRKNVFSAGVFTICAGSLFILAALPVMSVLSLFGGSAWLLVMYTIASCFHSLCAQFVRAEGKTSLFAVQGLINTALVIVFNVFMLAVLDLGVTGYALSVAAADIICFVFLTVKERLWRQIVIHPGRQIFIDMLKYGIPLIPTTVFWWITSVSDRYMITAFMGNEANGIYAVACKIPTVLTLISSIFLEAWLFSAVSETVKKRREQLRFYSQIWNVFMSVMFAAGSIVMAFSKWEIALLADDEYYNAWRYIPLLAAATVFSAFVTFMGSVFSVKKKSLLSFWSAMAGAGINLLLNGILIPSCMGIQGAAAATFTSYFIVFIVRARSARRLMPFRIHKRRLLINSMILAVQIMFILPEMPGWVIVQALCIVTIVIVNIKPIYSVVKKTILIKRKGEG